MNSKWRWVRAVAVLALAGGAFAAVSATPAGATGGKQCPTVRHENTGGITLAGTPAPTVTLGHQGVQVATPDSNNQGATWWQPVAPVPAGSVTRMSYWVKKVTSGVVPEAMPAYLLRLKVATGETATLVYEPYGNPNDDTDAPPAGAKTWNVAKGVFWTTDKVVAGMAEYAPNPHTGKSLADIAAANPGAQVVAFGWRQEWSKGLVAQVDKVTFGAGKKCAEHVWRKPYPKPTVTFDDTCVATVVKVTSPDDKAWKFWLTRGGKTVGGPATVDKGASEEFTVPAGPGEIVVLAKRDYPGKQWTPIGKHRWVEPAGCDADISAESTCDALKIRIVVPARSGPVKVVIAPGLNGEQTYEFDAEPGSTTNVTYPAEPGVVTVTVAGTPAKQVEWTKPADCDEPTPGPTATAGPDKPGTGGGDGDDLPLTGASTATTVAVGGFVLAAGVALIVLYFLTRRRRSAAIE